MADQGSMHFHSSCMAQVIQVWSLLVKHFHLHTQLRVSAHMPAVPDQQCSAAHPHVWARVVLCKPDHTRLYGISKVHKLLIQQAAI